MKAESENKVVPASVAFKEKSLSGTVFVKAREEIVSLTNLNKVYWPEEGYTKGDLLRYYYEVSKYILPYLKDRPLIMKRYPEGIEGISFHQHDVRDAPDYVPTAAIDVEEGHEVEYIIGGTLSTLLYMANLGAIERHPWHSRLANIDRPDWLVFDLDPGAGVRFTTICEIALSTKDILEKLGLESYAKTSGSRGIHVYVPLKAIHGYEQASDFSLKVATLVARANPEAATIERALKKRKRAQMYVDHMQNARGKSVVAPYSVRPKPGALVSAPLKWSEVKGMKIRLEDFTIATMPRRLARAGDLFKQVLVNKQSLSDALERVERMIGETRT